MVCNINYNTIWAHTGLGPQFYNATFSKFMHHMRTAQGLRNPDYRVLNRRRHPAIDRRLLWDL